MKTKFNFNVDKLKICYRQPEGLFELAASKLNDLNRIICFSDGFSLNVVWFDADNQDEVTEIKALIQFTNPDTGEIFKFATMDLSKTAIADGLCWVSLENASLYRAYNVGGWDFSYNQVLLYMAHSLGLEFNNITTLEIACDTTANVYAKLYRHIRNKEQFAMIMNGRKIKDNNERFGNISHPICRNGIIRRPTLYFDQEKKDAPHLCVYHKTDEIENHSGKDYITQWNSFGKAAIHRAEIRIKSNSFKTFWQWYTNNANEIRTDTRVLVTDQDGNVSVSVPTQLDSLEDPTFLQIAWQYFTDHLVYFRDLRGQKVTLTDLATN